MKSLKNNVFAEIYLKTLVSKYLDTMKKREEILRKLEKALKRAEQAQDWRLVSYVCQTINAVLNSYDETRFNEEYHRLKKLVEDAKKKLGQAGTGTPVA